MTHPTSNLVRAVAPATVELRAADGDAPAILAGHFAVFDQQTEINSRYEGRFLEQIQRGAFTDVIGAPERVKVLFDHGSDPSIGNKLLGKVRSLAEDDYGVRYEVELFTDAPFVRDLLPGLREGAYGASFRFSVADGGERWDQSGDGLPVRTITKVGYMPEFGPVSFPAYDGATAGMRSRTDEFHDALMNDPRFVARMTERMGLQVVEKILAELPPVGRAAITEPTERADGLDVVHAQARRQWLAARFYTKD